MRNKCVNCRYYNGDTCELLIENDDIPIDETFKAPFDHCEDWEPFEEDE